MRFAIFTHVIHQKHNGNYNAYAPYVREMELWLKYVAEVEVIAPLSKAFGTKAEQTDPMLSYQHTNLIFTKVPSFDLLNFSAIVTALFRIPIVFFRIFGAMRRADFLHLRCPGNIGLIACIVQILFPGKPKTAKYAGNWDPEANPPWSYKLQKWILANTFLTRNMKVLVYGDWPNDTKNVFPFFTASFPEDLKGTIITDAKPPYKFVFAGALVKGKRPFFAVKLVEELIKKQIPVVLEIYGNGILYKQLDEYIQHYNLEPFVFLHGNQKQEVLINAFKSAHFTILPSLSEGWPKAIAEGMFFGCIPITTAVSCVPWMLNYGSRGILFSEEEHIIENRAKRPFSGQWADVSQLILEETVDKIIELINNPEEIRRMSMEAQDWSQKYTLEKFEVAIKDVLGYKNVRP